MRESGEEHHLTRKVLRFVLIGFGFGFVEFYVWSVGWLGFFGGTRSCLVVKASLELTI